MQGGRDIWGSVERLESHFCPRRNFVTTARGEYLVFRRFALDDITFAQNRSFVRVPS